MDRVAPEVILSFFQEGRTYADISKILQNMYPGERGFSVRVVKRYCKQHGLSPRVTQPYLEQAIAGAVEEVHIFIQLILFYILSVILFYLS